MLSRLFPVVSVAEQRLLPYTAALVQQLARSYFDNAARAEKPKFDWGAARPSTPDDIPSIQGSVHSVESFSAVDGPGVRFLVFLQGCGYRCVFCSNPDTWAMQKGKLMTSKELARRMEKVRPYLAGHGGGPVGGITVSGGEAMLQPEFVAALFMEAHVRGLTSCIDTTGQGTKAHHWDVVLPHTDYALFCIKSPDPQKYLELTKRPMANTLKFWDQLEAHSVKYWVRYVLIPGLTDSLKDIEHLERLCQGRKSLQAVEVLPYHMLGVQKWEEMGMAYPLTGQKPPTAEQTLEFTQHLTNAGINVLCNKFS